MASSPQPLPRINDGSPFFGLAQAYRASGDVLMEHMDTASSLDAGIPVRFVYSHAVELYLKAFLMIAGYPAKQLATKKFGHDLEALMR